MSEDIFDGQLLADKLIKLNSSQRSIEYFFELSREKHNNLNTETPEGEKTLSRWCITHRKKAKQIVESWDKLFKSAQRDQCVSFLYLSNDILQNSRCQGNEFVNEFWKVLPAALKNVYGTCDENGKKAASRLVDIWEERKVFGSRGHNLKDAILGKNPRPTTALASNLNSSDPIKIVKRDAHSLRLVSIVTRQKTRIKLDVGTMLEKIVTSFQSVHDQHVDEQDVFNKFKNAIFRAGEIERNAEGMSSQANLQGSHLVKDIQEQETILQQCINQLESAKGTRTALVSQLKDAVREQEPVLERLRTQLLAARVKLDQVVTLRGKLMLPPAVAHSQQMDTARASEATFSLPQATNLPPAAQTVISAIPKTTEDDDKKAVAAAVVAKLAASASSAQMLSCVFSSLVAEEAASMSTGSNLSGFSSGSSMFPQGKKPRLEKPMSAPDANNSEAGHLCYFASQQPSSTVPFPPAAALPPLPPGLPCNLPTNQFVQPASLPYGYGSTSLPPPPPLTSHVTMGLAKPAPPQQQQAPQTQMQQQNNNGGYYRPPGIGFYGGKQSANTTVHSAVMRSSGSTGEM